MRPSADNPTVPPRSRRTILTMAGVLYGLTTLFLAVGAVNGQNNLLFWSFGLALGGIMVSGFFSGSGMMGLRLRRRVAAQARAGEPLAIHYDAQNVNRMMPLFCVTVTEQGTRAGDRLTRPAAAFLSKVGAGMGSEVTARVIPSKRGRLSLETVAASSSFPIGLMRKVMYFDQAASVLVLPARLRLRESILPRPARRGHGGSASPTSTGHGDEFFGVRSYVAGDSPRLIAWRPSARGDELVVRQQGTPPPVIAWIHLHLERDVSALENERAIALAGSAAEMLAERGCSVGLIVESAGIVRSPAPGMWHARRLLALLALVDLETLWQEGRRATATPRVQREHAILVVRAGRRAEDSGGAEGGATPRWAMTLVSSRIGEYLAPGFALPKVLSDPPTPETPRERVRRLLREFFLVDPVGDAAMGAGSESESGGAGASRAGAGRRGARGESMRASGAASEAIASGASNEPSAASATTKSAASAERSGVEARR